MLWACILAINVFAQAPQLMNYQAVVRDASGQPLSGGLTIAVRFRIHQGNNIGPIVYLEETTTLTNEFGLINVQIGATNDLSTVNWGNGAATYLEVGIDPSGGYNLYYYGHFGNYCGERTLCIICG